jgi:hypothetical protein
MTQQTEGRRRNAAAPLGERPGLVSKKKTEEIGKQSLTKAGPDGGSAKAVGDTFKKKP